VRNFQDEPFRKENSEKGKIICSKFARIRTNSRTANYYRFAKIASEVVAEIVGLEHKLKSEESLTRKISDESAKSAKSFVGFGYSIDEAIEKSTKRQAERNNDALRYTFIFSFEKYVFGFRQSLQKLKQKGFEITENKIWNAWKNIGTTFDKGYRGINITVISSQGQIFELQLQTSQARKVEIAEIIIELAKKVKTPKGVNKL
jgi:hypothetical protein